MLDQRSLFYFLTDLSYVCLLSHKVSASELEKVYLKCFSVSLSGVCGNGALLSDIPASNKPANGYGIRIDLTGKERWQSFATSSIKLLSKFLTEGTLYVEGLLDTSSVLAACSLLCYGDSDLHIVSAIPIK